MNYSLTGVKCRATSVAKNHPVSFLCFSEMSCATKTNGSNCVFPFIYKGVEYNGCAYCQRSNSLCLEAWCATKTDASYGYISGIPNGFWDYCTDSCPNTQGPHTGAYIFERLAVLSLKILLFLAFIAFVVFTVFVFFVVYVIFSEKIH